jgi:hypothetical protein
LAQLSQVPMVGFVPDRSGLSSADFVDQQLDGQVVIRVVARS